MTGLEITLVVTGVIFLIGSFLVKDKLSPKDIDKIAALSEEELKILVEKQIDNARNTIDDAIEEETLKSREATKRAEDNRVFLAIQAFCMIFNIARLVISSITKVNCGDSVIVLSIFVAGIVCVEKMIKVCDRE